MISVSDSFKHDTLSANNYLIPFVIFEWASGEKLHISTNKMTFDGVYYSPLLKTLPSLTESIGIQSRKYKISSMTLKISAYKHGDIYFGDSLTDSTGDYLIGSFCNVYFKSQSAKVLDDCLRIYKGIVRDIKISSSYVSVKLEDISQELLHIELPRTKLGGGEEIMEDYRNAPYPMVYGTVDKSPCIVGELSDPDEDYQKNAQVIAESNPGVEILNNLDPIVINATIDGQNGDTTYGEPKSYVMAFINGKYVSINKEVYDTELDIWKYQMNPIENPDGSWYNDYLLGDQTNSPYGEIVNGEWIPGSNPNIIMFKGVQDADMKTNLIALNMAECFYVASTVNIRSFSDVDNYITFYENVWQHNPVPIPFEGSETLTWEDTGSFDDKYTCIRHNITVEEPPGKKQYERRARIVQGYVKGHVTFGDLYVSPDAVHYNYGLCGYKGYDPTDLPFEHDDDFYWGTWIAWRSSLLSDGEGRNDCVGNEGSMEYEGEPTTVVAPISNNEVFTFDHYSRKPILMSYNYFDNWNKPILETDTWAFRLFVRGGHGGHTDTQTIEIKELDLDFKVVNLYHIEDLMEQKFFCSIIGRTGINGSVSPPNVIVDIIQNEMLGGDVTVNAEELTTALEVQAGWKTAFTVSKRIDGKKLIEAIAKESKSFIFVNNLGEFSFATILDAYQIESHTEDDISFVGTGVKGYFIDRADVIRLKIKRTRLRDIKTKVELLYKYDYGLGNHLKTTADNNIPQTAVELFPEYSNTYYGIKSDEEQGDSPIKLDYIRDDATANALHQRLLTWNCNQHNIFSLRLPLNYLKYEIGDVIAFKELIEDKKAYNEDYSFNKRALLNETIIRNGQEIYPFFMITKTKKSLDRVDMELIQLHNMTDVESEAINLAPTASVTFVLSDDGGDSADNVYDSVYGSDPSIVLDGTGSSDPDGDTLSYEWHYDEDVWEIVSGTIDAPNLELLFTGTLPTMITPPQIHTFRLTVSDGQYSHTSNPVTIHFINTDSDWSSDSTGYIGEDESNGVGWNFISLPVSTEINEFTDLFPDGIPGCMFSWNGTYSNENTLTPGVGYWAKILYSSYVVFVGDPIDSIEISLIVGWNLIGSLTTVIFPTPDYIDDPDGILTPPFAGSDWYTIYGFSPAGDTSIEPTPGGYGESAGYYPGVEGGAGGDETLIAIEPGRGYWIHAESAGTITLHT